jgi:hypothetical protein
MDESVEYRRIVESKLIALGAAPVTEPAKGAAAASAEAGK